MKQSKSCFSRNPELVLETQRITTRLREQSPVVSLAKHNAFFVPQRQMTRLDRAKKGIVAGIEVDQKLLYRRFQRLLSQTRLRQAQMDGNRTLEGELRKERLSRMEGRAALGCHSEWDELEKVLHGTHLTDPKGDLTVPSGRSPHSPDRIRRHSSAPSSAWLSSKLSTKPPTASVLSTMTPVQLKTVRCIPVALFSDVTAGQVKINSEDLDSDQEQEEDDAKVQQLEAVLENNTPNGQPSTTRRQMTSVATPNLIQSRPSFVSHRPSTGATDEDTKHENLPLIELQLRRVREATDDCLRRVHGFYAKLDQCSDGSDFDYYARRFSWEPTKNGFAADPATPFANNSRAKVQCRK